MAQEGAGRRTRATTRRTAPTPAWRPGPRPARARPVPRASCPRGPPTEQHEPGHGGEERHQPNPNKERCRPRPPPGAAADGRGPVSSAMPTHSAGDPAHTSPAGTRPATQAPGSTTARPRRARPAGGCSGRRCGRGPRRGSGRRAPCRPRSTSPRGRRPGRPRSRRRTWPTVIGTCAQVHVRPDLGSRPHARTALPTGARERPDAEHGREAFGRPKAAGARARPGDGDRARSRSAAVARRARAPAPAPGRRPAGGSRR